MKLQIQKRNRQITNADVFIASCFEDEMFSHETTYLNEMTGGLLAKLVKKENFTGKADQTVSLFFQKSLKQHVRILLVGLGKQEEVQEESVRQVAATAVQMVRSWQGKHVVSDFFGMRSKKFTLDACAKAMAEGLWLGTYDFAKYKSSLKEKKFFPETWTFMTEHKTDIKLASKGLSLGEMYADATIFARNLVNEPAQHMRPADLVAVTKAIVAASSKTISMRVFNRAQLEKKGAGGILGVARGSDHEPFLVHLVYKPLHAKKRMVLVGKAVTFDSGGISLKPSDAMTTMKIDMAGAAAVLGVFSVLPDLELNVEIHGIFAACENMPSGKAIVPGDIVRIMNGKTVEVLNTDAEGRVTLADALTYALQQKPDVMIDLATLTGACVVALGEEVAGMMSNDRTLCDELKKAADRAGERVWELPLEPGYKKLLHSEVADLKNIAGRYGGAVTAGLFLQEFVEEVPWAHLDIAGPAFAEKPLNSYTKYGASGFGTRTILEYIRSM
ncbi:MAG: putative cytosol aminopeptidase [Candidatus Uhrbacteria bacterium GW2011_GWF2_41_16]|uniref:Probable cytosol aminopeptidase n=1 Tax=Candidatus Uhrbacteria bacterium GW2011_GWF2_41_16 TaxID=1618997 RepID=A0A0G0V9J8_9BACT|nr:MAG: putative cytosol aminopeptidase [Candidatus Uhrbacteria bacterium GW2011_GWF2_41_16]